MSEVHFIHGSGQNMCMAWEGKLSMMTFASDILIAYRGSLEDQCIEVACAISFHLSGIECLVRKPSDQVRHLISPMANDQASKSNHENLCLELLRGSRKRRCLHKRDGQGDVYMSLVSKLDPKVDAASTIANSSCICPIVCGLMICWIWQETSVCNVRAHHQRCTS